MFQLIEEKIHLLRVKRQPAINSGFALDEAPALDSGTNKVCGAEPSLMANFRRQDDGCRKLRTLNGRVGQSGDLMKD